MSIETMLAARRYLLLASYCGGDKGKVCTEYRPCNDCLAMCNVFRVSDAEPVFDHELGPEPEAVVPAGMVPWHGGDSAPADYDGGPFLRRNRAMFTPSNGFSAGYWGHCGSGRDIVAYTPKQATPTDEAVLADHIREQITHVEQRIQDGHDLGAAVWRIALEDVVRENKAILEARSAPGSGVGSSDA